MRLGEGTEDTRRVATLEEVGRDKWELITYLAGSESRLLVTGRDDKSGQETVEVVHEALIREWGRLREWVNQNREKLIQQRKIETLATDWRDKKKSKDYLLGGKQLNEAKAFQKEQAVSFTLSDLAGEFIQKSVKYRRNNRLRLIGFGFTPIIFLTIFLGFAGYKQIEISRLRNDIEKAQGQKYNYPRIKALEELVKLGEPLNNIYLEQANLNNANLNNAELNRANLIGADLSSANLIGANLGGTILSRAALDYAKLNDANLISAVLYKTRLTYAELSRANLNSANLISADFISADLSYANLSYANLYEAYLRRADLNGANLKGANLKGAKFGCVKNNKGETIKCTNLRGAKNLTPEQVKQAKNWQQAEYDPEFRKQLGLPPVPEKQSRFILYWSVAQAPF